MFSAATYRALLVLLVLLVSLDLAVLPDLLELLVPLALRVTP